MPQYWPGGEPDISDLGRVILVKRKDTGGDLATANGRYAPLQADKTGNVRMADDFPSGEVLAEQSGAGSVLTFTFVAPVNLAFVMQRGSATSVSHADPFGGEPSATLGIPCLDEVPVALPVITTIVKVHAPSGTTISVWGYRR